MQNAEQMKVKLVTVAAVVGVANTEVEPHGPVLAEIEPHPAAVATLEKIEANTADTAAALLALNRRATDRLAETAAEKVKAATTREGDVPERKP